MAKFTDKLNDPNTNFIRSTRGVQDNSTATAIAGIGEAGVEIVKQDAIDTAKQETSTLQSGFLGNNAFGGGGGGDDNSTGAVVSRYVNGGGSQQEATVLNEFGKKIDKLRTLEQSTNQSDQYKIRAEALLKTQMNRMPGLSNEFKAIAGGILGTGSINVQLKAQAEREQRANAEKDLQEIEKDAGSLGLKPGDVFTAKGQQKYLARADMRSKFFEANQLLQYDKMLKERSELHKGKTLDKFETAKRDADFLKNQVDIRDRTADLKAGIGVDPKILSAKVREQVGDQSGRARSAAEGILGGAMQELGFERPSLEFFKKLSSEQKAGLRSDLIKDRQRVRDELQASGVFEHLEGKELEEHVNSVLFSHDQILKNLTGDEAVHDIENTLKTASAVHEMGLRSSNIGRMVSTWAKLGIPVDERTMNILREEGLSGQNQYLRQVFSAIAPQEKGDPSISGKAALQAQKDSEIATARINYGKLEADHTLQFALQLAEKAASGSEEASGISGDVWGNIGNLYSPGASGEMKKAAMDSLVDVIVNPANDTEFQHIQKADAVVQKQIRSSLGRHYSKLLRKVDAMAKDLRPAGIDVEEGERFLDLNINEEGIVSVTPGKAMVKLGRGFDAQGLENKVNTLNSGKVMSDFNRTMQAIKKFGGKESTYFKQAMKGTIWGDETPNDDRTQSKSEQPKLRDKKKVKVPNLTDHIKEIEKFTDKPFWDHKQFTSGFGTKAKNKNEKITKEEATKRLDKRLKKDVSRIEKFVPDNTPQGIKNALTSLSFNAGTGWMKAGLGSAVKKGDWKEAKKRFLQYNKASGKVQKGLVKRRKIEAEWFDG